MTCWEGHAKCTQGWNQTVKWNKWIEILPKNTASDTPNKNLLKHVSKLKMPVILLSVDTHKQIVLESTVTLQLAVNKDMAKPNHTQHMFLILTNQEFNQCKWKFEYQRQWWILDPDRCHV